MLTNQIVGQVDGLENAGMIQITNDGKTAFVSRSSTAPSIYNIIYAIDTETMTKKADISLPVTGLPHAIWLTSDDKKLFVGNMTKNRMEQRNYTEKIRGERGILERIMNYIPFYHGYKEKELRRDSDRMVRADVVNRLKQAKTMLRRQFADPSLVGRLTTADTFRLETVNQRLDRVTQRVDRAVAGYARDACLN